MTAGKWLIHSETSSEDFKAKGGPLEILQLWVNLPAALKSVAPAYTGLQSPEVPVAEVSKGVSAELVSGELLGNKAAIQSISDVHLSIIRFEKSARLRLEIPASRTILFYLINGSLNVNESGVSGFEIVEFNREGTFIEIEAEENSVLLFGHAEPNNEPIVAHGPFVMNTHEEIREAFLQFGS